MNQKQNRMTVGMDCSWQRIGYDVHCMLTDSVQANLVDLALKGSKIRQMMSKELLATFSVREYDSLKVKSS